MLFQRLNQNAEARVRHAPESIETSAERIPCCNVSGAEAHEVVVVTSYPMRFNNLRRRFHKLDELFDQSWSGIDEPDVGPSLNTFSGAAAPDNCAIAKNDATTFKPAYTRKAGAR
jgi:hypothetical protein